MSKRRTPKARTMKLLDEATMTYKTVHLYDVAFLMKNGDEYTVQVYSPCDDEVLAVANRLYENKGAFGSAVSFARTV